MPTSISASSRASGVWSRRSTFRPPDTRRWRGKADPDVLIYCADQERVLVTHDQKTMPHHFAEFIAGRSSPGVIIVPQDMPIGQAVQELYLA